jgi:hypothetical protein
MLSKDAVSSATNVNELGKLIRVFSSHYKSKVRGEDEWSTLTLDTKLLLEVTKEVTKVDVEEMSCFGNHDIIVVSGLLDRK